MIFLWSTGVTSSKGHSWMFQCTFVANSADPINPFAQRFLSYFAAIVQRPPAHSLSGHSGFITWLLVPCLLSSNHSC